MRRIVLMVYEGFQLLDLAGPTSVFSTANQVAEKILYEVAAASSSGGHIVSSGGVSVSSVAIRGLKFRKSDTVLVTGGNREALRQAAGDSLLVSSMRNASKRAERYGSVCSGTFIVGAAGLLAGRPCATHWAGAEELSRRFPDALVDKESLYVNDGRLWTSAGVTTGIDMALSILRADHGSELMGKVAKQLVVYAHRPGHQSQFSLLLSVQTAGEGEFAPLVDWITEVMDQPIKVRDMAEHVLMTERTFYRKFTADVGITPSKFLETVRLQRAKELLEAGQAVKSVTRQVGFRSEAAFRTAFKARFGVTPSMHSMMFQGAVAV